MEKQLLLNDHIYRWDNLGDRAAIASIDSELFDFLDAFFGSAPTLQVQTSGTTGAPKTYYLERSAFLASAKKTINFFALGASQTFGLALPMRSIAAKMMVIRAYLAQANLQTLPINANPIANLSKRIDFLAITPHQAQVILDKNPEKMFNCHTILLGGSGIPPLLEEQLRALAHPRVFHSYGMTETLSHVAIRNVSQGEQWFTILPGFGLTLDERGCLCIKSDFFSPVITNDIAEIASGKLRIAGRWDLCVNSGGVKLFPEELEKKITHLFKHPFLIAAKSDRYLGEKLVLVIAADSAAYSGIAEEIKLFLTNYESPKEIIFVKELPYNTNGKLLRRWPA